MNSHSDVEKPVEDHGETREISRATRVLAASTMASRVLGLVRNQVLAIFFGAGFQSDAFIAAFTIPNALRRLFGEGALTPAFVSLFTRSLKEPESEWRAFIHSSFSSLIALVGSLSLLGIVFAEPLVQLYVPHFADTPGKLELTVQLTRFLFPFILLISIAALFMGILNSFREFFLPAIGPAVLNLTVIVLAPTGILLLLSEEQRASSAIFVFAACFLLGVFFQLIIQIPRLWQLRALPRFTVMMKNDRVKELGLLLAPAILSMGIHQLNIIVNRIFASDIPGAVSHLFYADLVIELPVSLIATSMATAAVPTFTRLLDAGDSRGLGESFRYSASLNLALSLPAMLGVLVLGLPIIVSLFGYGAFTKDDAWVTSQCLFFYALGLPFFCLIRSLIPLYFAQKDTKTPALIGLVALGVNFVGAWQLSGWMGAPGIALATSLSSLVNFGLLALIVVIRFPYFPWLSLLLTLGKTAFGALLMGAALWLLAHFWLQAPTAVMEWGLALRVGFLLAMVLMGLLTYALTLRALRMNEFFDLFRRFKS